MISIHTKRTSTFDWVDNCMPWSTWLANHWLDMVDNYSFICFFAATSLSCEWQASNLTLSPASTLTHPLMAWRQICCPWHIVMPPLLHRKKLHMSSKTGTTDAALFAFTLQVTCRLSESIPGQMFFLLWFLLVPQSMTMQLQCMKHSCQNNGVDLPTPHHMINRQVAETEDNSLSHVFDCVHVNNASVSVITNVMFVAVSSTLS